MIDTLSSYFKATLLYHTIHLFKLYHSMAFSILKKMMQPYCRLILEHFFLLLCPKEILCLLPATMLFLILSFNVVKVKVAQSCPTLCDPMDHSVHGILQARILEWVAFPFSRESSRPRDRTQVSCIEGGFFTS